MTPGVGVVVLDLDQEHLTRRCVRSLARGSRVPDAIVVVENGRHQCALDGATDAPAVTTIVLHPGWNLGCGGGRNLGLNYLARNTTIETLVVLDNDTIVAPDMIENLAGQAPKPFEAVAPVIYDLESGAVWSTGGTVDPDGGVRQLDEAPGNPDAQHMVDWAPGACLAFHRDTWALVGGFDTSLDFLFEDIEWCHRLRSAGGLVLVRPDLTVEHEPHQSLGGRWSPTRVRYWARNGTIFRVAVAKAGAGPTARWLAEESLLSLRDLALGRFPGSAARIVGLVQGGTETLRRRIGPPTREAP